MSNNTRQKPTARLKWNFPATGGGYVQGFNDGAQEHFRNNALGNAIREIVQNSLDAADTRRDKPVTMKIFEMSIPASEMGAKDLAAHTNKALERSSKDKNNAGIAFYKNALKILDSKEIRVLAITDANTTGLVDEKWEALIYNEGTPSKGSMTAAGGSFGIGKNAPYLISALRTICYSTRYLSRAGRQEKFIARCRSSTHDSPKSASQELQHIGFGTKSATRGDIRSPTEGSNIHEKFRLERQGSGIFIMGFEPGTKDWIKTIKESIARYFFTAIHEEKLEINIETECLNRDTLDQIFENSAKIKHARQYYHIIRDDLPKDMVETEFGRFTLQVRIDDDNLPNKIAYVNRRGMLVTDIKKFKMNPFYSNIGQGWVRFAAVVIADDDKTDAKIRSIEPPSHQSIEYKRIRDHEKLKTTLKQLREIQPNVQSIISGKISDSQYKHGTAGSCQGAARTRG